jgi:hypothetical protein
VTDEAIRRRRSERCLAFLAVAFCCSGCYSSVGLKGVSGHRIWRATETECRKLDLGIRERTSMWRAEGYDVSHGRIDVIIDQDGWTGPWHWLAPRRKILRVRVRKTGEGARLYAYCAWYGKLFHSGRDRELERKVLGDIHRRIRRKNETAPLQEPK